MAVWRALRWTDGTLSRGYDSGDLFGGWCRFGRDWIQQFPIVGFSWTYETCYRIYIRIDCDFHLENVTNYRFVSIVISRREQCSVWKSRHGVLLWWLCSSNWCNITWESVLSTVYNIVFCSMLITRKCRATNSWSLSIVFIQTRYKCIYLKRMYHDNTSKIGHNMLICIV